MVAAIVAALMLFFIIVLTLVTLKMIRLTPIIFVFFKLRRTSLRGMRMTMILFSELVVFATHKVKFIPLFTNLLTTNIVNLLLEILIFRFVNS